MRDIEGRARNHCCLEKAISITYLCVFTRACSLNYPACNAHAPYFMRPLWLHHIFRHYLINGTIFEKKMLNTKCVFWFSLQLSFEKFLLVKRIKRDVAKNVEKSSCKLPLLLSEFKETWIFSTDFRKNLRYQVFLKIRLVEAELFHADG